MLSKVPFYHGTTKKLVIAFGGLFGNIFCRTKDKTGVTQKIVKVPIAFAQKEKFIVRLQQDPGLAEDVQIVLPRLAFEITGLDYDSSRQMNKIHKIKGAIGERNIFSYMPVPYNVSFALYSFTRTTEDNLQIMEQILPYFTPEMNLSIKMIQTPAITQDIPLTLNSVNTDDQYDGGFEDRRYIITTYSFTMKAFYYGPILGSMDLEKHFDDGTEVNVIKKVEATINNSHKYSVTIDPFTANSDEIFSMVEGWEPVIPEIGDPTL
jgi:hypothetical protein